MPVKKMVPTPFWRSERNCWFVQIGKKQHRLDPDETTAWRLYHELMAKPLEQRDARTLVGVAMQSDSFNLHCMLEKRLTHGLPWLAINAIPYMPWHDGTWEGFKQLSGADKVTPEIIEFFKESGWRLEPGDSGIIYGAPLVYIEPPRFLYHLTPFFNVRNITEKGLLTGEEARRSTSGRKYCRNAIYACISEAKARKWVTEELIGKSGHKDWGLLRISSAHLTGGVYRDPASQTDYILEDKHVSNPELIERIFS